MSVIQTVNQGPRIVSSTYWGSEYARAGKLYVSVNDGAVRILTPPALRPVLAELRTAEYAILSLGPWPEAGVAEGVEILWEDHTDSAFAWYVTAANFDLLPAAPPPGHGWTIAVWDLGEDGPYPALERPCHWRRVAKIPCLRPLGS